MSLLLWYVNCQILCVLLSRQRYIPGQDTGKHYIWKYNTPYNIPLCPGPVCVSSSMPMCDTPTVCVVCIASGSNLAVCHWLRYCFEPFIPVWCIPQWRCQKQQFQKTAWFRKYWTVFVTDTKGLLRPSHLILPSVKVSPEAHSTPNMATMSPALAEEMSSSSLACMRTSRGTYNQVTARWHSVHIQAALRLQAGQTQLRLRLQSSHTKLTVRSYSG